MAEKDILALYNESQNRVVQEAKEIPLRAANAVDIFNVWSDNFTLGVRSGDLSNFTTRALNYYDEELSNLTPPIDFSPIAPDIQLNRWRQGHKYGAPGNWIE